MPDLQALLRFPGISGVIRWTFTLSHGISPSVCSVDVVPQANLPAEMGTLQILFGGVRMQFRDCLIDSAKVRRSLTGQIVGLAILDRRWKWKFGEISGRYNLRLNDGKIDATTEKTPHELATLLLRAMGESAFSVGELPNVARPEVDWNYANPAHELAALAESLGCRVVLGIDNRVSLRRIGVGALLPNVGAQRSEDFGFDPPTRPDSIKLIGGPTRFQTKFRLEAVGEDSDGAIRPIDELKYKPAGGWGSESGHGTFTNILNADDRTRAQRSVFRWYRIASTAETDQRDRFTIPGIDKPIERRWQLLPLETGLVATYRDDDGTERPRPAVVEGIYWLQFNDGRNTPSIRRYDGAFTINAAAGIVEFFLPVTKLELDSGNNRIHAPAELYLTIAHGVKAVDARLALRFTHERRLPGRRLGTGPHLIHREDVVRTVIGNYQGRTPRSVTDNSQRLISEAAAALDAAQAEFKTLQTAEIEYAGIVPIAPDGAIQQVVWNGSLEGGTTKASRNHESSLVVPSHKERRAAEKQRGAPADERRNAERTERRLRGGR
jgi:hypothetical protein